jgi:transposase
MANLRSNTKPSRARTTAGPVGPVGPVGAITGGVDTHRDFHVAAAKDSLGRELGTKKFTATQAGYAALTAWLRAFGPLDAVGVEGTGCYGAGLTTYLLEQDITVLEVNRPNRQKRRRTGKSDALDAIAAAAAVQSGEATAAPRPRTGPIESVRVLKETRDLLVKARTAALNTLHALITTAPPELREQLDPMSTSVLIGHCATFSPPAVPVKHSRGPARAHTVELLTQTLLDHHQTVRITLGELARTIQHHTTQLATLDTCLHTLVTRIAPATSALPGVGPGRAAQLLITAGDHPERIHSERAFARLTGVAPLECFSGQHQGPHRLSRAGDRQANSVLYYIAITRMAHHQPTRDYITQRLRPGTTMTKKHLIRCVKRYIAREIYPRLITDLTNLENHHPTT